MAPALLRPLLHDGRFFRWLQKEFELVIDDNDLVEVLNKLEADVKELARLPIAKYGHPPAGLPGMMACTMVDCSRSEVRSTPIASAADVPTALRSARYQVMVAERQRLQQTLQQVCPARCPLGPSLPLALSGAAPS
jgi:hypothetical protein